VQGPDAYVPLTEAAQWLGVSVDTVRRRIRTGELVAQREQRPQGYRWLVKLPEPPTVIEVHPATSLHLPMHLQGVDSEGLERLIVTLERVSERLAAVHQPPALIADYVPTLQLVRTNTAPPRLQAVQTPMRGGRLPWWRRILQALTEGP